MKIPCAILNAALLVLCLGIVSARSAQNVPAEPETAEQSGHWTALALVREVNTAEAVEQGTYSHFSSWQVLLTHYQPSFDDFAKMSVHRQQIPSSRFAEPPEIMPGWNLRLNVHPDGQGYDLMLQDMNDKKCAYALFTNETAVIWETKTIDCEVRSQNSPSEQN